MTKKDFEVIAKVIKSRVECDSSDKATLWWTAQDLAGVFGAGNPRFDRKRFLIACGVPLSLDE